MSDDVTPTVPAPDLFAARAAERVFPSRLPAPGRVAAPGAGGGLELGAPVQLYTSDAAPFPVPSPGPAGAPPIVASGPGDRVGGYCGAGTAGRLGPGPRSRFATALLRSAWTTTRGCRDSRHRDHVLLLRKGQTACVPWPPGLAVQHS